MKVEMNTVDVMRSILVSVMLKTEKIVGQLCLRFMH